MFPFDNRAITWIFLVLVFYVLVDSNKAENEPRVVCYYTNWSVYRPGTAKFNPQNINPYLCTHLIYAFGGFTKDNALKPFDKYQDIEQGGYAKFTGLKTYNKNLKTMLAIGGWNEGSTRFSPLMANKDRRHQFVKNIIKFLRQNHFDGLDLDWEYPAYRDGGKPRDRANYAQFVQELREEFERESSKTGRPRLLLTMAVPAGIEYIEKGYDIPKLNQYLDWFNILSYDYHSAYEPSVNHHSPLYSLEEASEYNYDTELNIDYSVKFYLNAGADRDKIVLGIPTYGRSFTLLNEDATDIGAPADGPGEQGDATREKGYLAYYEICQNLKNDEDWTVIQPNPSAMGPYAFKGNQWVGYDDEDIVRKKSKYVAQNGLGGIMFWSIDNDDFRGSCHGKPYPLIEAAKEALYNALQPGYNEVLSSPTKKPTRPRNRNKSRNKLKEESTTESYTTKRTTTPKYSGGRTTTPPPPTTPDPGSDFKCEDEGFFPHPRDCKKYFWCLDSGPSNLGIVAHQFTCPSGLVFNKATDSCDYTRNVICSKLKSTKAPAIETTTVGRTTTTRRVAITAATSRNSFIKITTKKPTTTTPADEYEYEDDVEDDVGTPKFKVDEEDPKVIKELIDLIKKAGGVEQLEKHLNLQGNSEASEVLTKLKSSTSGSASTSSPIKKSLYDRVLSGRNNNNKGVYSRNRFSSTITEDEKNESSGASEATQRPSYSQINRNSRPQPQNAGLENLQEFDAFIGDKPQYQTIKRTRPTTPATSTIDENEDDDDDDDDDDTQGSNNNYSVRPTSSYSADLNTTPKRRYVSLSRTTLSPTTITDAKEEDDHSTTKYKTIERSRPTTTRSEIQESEPLATPAEVETTVSNLNSNLDSANTTPTQSTRTYAILTRRTTTVSSHDPTTAQQTDDIIITTQSNRDNEADHLDEKFITSIDEIRPSTTQSDIITVTESLPNPIDTEPLDSENNEVKYPKESNGIINTLPSAIASDSINQLVNINNFNDGVNSQFNSTESKLIIGNENDVLNATGAVVSKISNLINDIIVNTSNTGSSLTGITNQLVTTSYSPPLQSQTSATNQNNENVLVSSPRPFRRRTGPTVAHVKSSTASSYTTGQLTNNRKVSNINTQRRKTVNYFGTQETLNPNDEENQVSNYLDSSDASSELHESNVNSISTISDNNYTPFSFRPSKPIFSFSFDSKTTYTNTDNDETTSTIFESSTIPSTKFTFRGRQFTRSSSTVGTKIPTSTESFQFNNRNKFRRNRFEISTPETIIESSSINSLKSRGGSRFRDGSTKRSIEEQSTFEPTTSKYSRGFGRTLEDKTTQDSVIKFTFPQYSNSDTTTTEAPTDSPILKLSVKTLPRFNARSETDSEHPDKKSITESQIFYVKTTENPLYNTDIKNDDEILNNEFSISGGAIRHASEKHSDDLEKASNIDTTQFPQNILNPLLAIDLLEKDGVTDLFPTIDGSTDYPTTLEFSSPETTRFSTTTTTSHRPTHTTRTAIRRRPYLARSTSTTTRPSTEEHRIRNNELSHRLPTSTTPKPTRKYIPNRGRGTVKYDDTTATTQATTKEQLLPIYRESIYNYDGQDNYNSDDYEQATEAVRRPLVTRRVVTRRPTTERTTTEREANERRNFNSVRSEFNRPPSRFAIRSRNRVRTTSTSTTETYPEDEFNSQTESPELFSTQTSRSTRPRFNPFRSKTTESINSEEYVDSQTSVPETFTPQTIRTTRPRFKSFRLRTTDATTSEEYNNSETESSEPISSQESSTSFPRISSFRLRTTESYSDDTDPQTEFTETDVSQLTTSSLPRFSSFRLRTTDSSSSYASLSHTESPEAVTSETQRSTRPRFTSFRRRTTSEAPLVSNEDINDEYDQSNGSVEIPVSSTPLPRSRFSLFRSRNQLRSGDQLNESNNEQLDLSNNSNESVDSAVTQSSTSYRPTFRRRNGYRQRQEQSSVAPISEEINSSSTKSTLNRRRLTYRRSTTPTPDTNLSLTVAESRDELQSPDEQSNEEVIDPVTPPIRRRKVIRKKKILKNPTTSGDIESTPEIEVASSDDLNSELKSSTEPINSESPIDETTPVVLSSTTKRRFRKIIRKLRPRLNEQKQNETVSNEDQSNEEVKPLISTTRKGKSQDFDKIAETSNEVTIPEEESTTLDSQVISSTTDETTSTEGRPRSKLIGHRGSYNPRDRLRTSSPTAASTTERAPSIRKFTRKYNSQAVSSTENENSENDTSDESEDRNVPSIRPISELSQTNRLRNTYRPSNRFANTGSSPRDDDVLVRRPNFNIYNRGNRFNQNENEDNDENNDEEEFNDNQQSNEDEGLNDLNDEEEEDEAGFQARPPSPATSRYPSFRPRFRATPTPSLVRSSTRSRFRTTTIRSISDETGSSPRTRTRGYRRRPTTESSPVAQQDRELNVNALNARNKKIFNNRRFTSTTPSTTVESHTTNIDDIATTLSLLDTEHATTLETNSNDEPTNEFSKRLTEHLNNLQAARRSTPKDSLFNTNRNGVRKPLKPTTTTTAKPTTLHHVFAIDYDENSISNDTKSGKFNSTDDSFESGEVISKHLVKLAEVNRIVEIYSQQEKYKLNTNSKELSNKFDQSNLILEKEPTLDKLGEVHRLTLIKVKDQSPLAYTIDSISSLADYTPTTPSTTTSFTPVRNSIPTFDGKPSENEESASEKRARNLLLSDIIFGVETSTLPVEALFNEADRKAKKLESDSTVNSVTETELPTTITTEMPDESGKDAYVRPPVPLLRPESQELAPLVISIANLDRVILTKASPHNETSDGNRIQDSQNEINSEDETTVATTESIDSRTETTFEATTTVDTTTVKSNKFIPKKRQGRPTFRPAATRRPVLSIRKPSTTKLPSYEVTEISESNESIRGTTVPFVATTARRIRPSFQVRRKTTPVPTTTEIPETTTKISIRRRYPRPTEHRYSSTIRTITSSEPSVSSTSRPRIQIYRRKYPGRTTTPGIRSSTVRTTTESQLDYTTHDFDQTLQPSDNKFSKNRYNQIGESIEDDVVNAIKTISKAPLPAVSSTTIRYRYPVIRGSSTVANAKESDHHQDATESIVAKHVLFNPTSRKSILRRPYLNTVTSISSTTVSSIPVISTTINSIVSQPLRSKRPKAKPFEKTETTPTVRQAKYEPVNNDYDYYDDEQERVISKSNSQVKVVLHGRGLIECLDQGNFPHPISCRKFISCAKMETGGVVGWEYTCPKGLSYDPVGGICNWSAGVGCKD